MSLIEGLCKSKTVLNEVDLRLALLAVLKSSKIPRTLQYHDIRKLETSGDSSASSIDLINSFIIENINNYNLNQQFIEKNSNLKELFSKLNRQHFHSNNGLARLIKHFQNKHSFQNLIQITTKYLSNFQLKNEILLIDNATDALEFKNQ